MKVASENVEGRPLKRSAFVNRPWPKEIGPFHVIEFIYK
jgi:hypothetical protein